METITKLSQQITKLIDNGMWKVNDQIGSFGTILNYWAGRPTGRTEEESLAVVEILLDRGANLQIPDGKGLTPILNAALEENLAVLDHLLKRSDISQKEKIDAMELAGAMMILKDPSPKAFEYWRQATLLRSMVTKKSGPVFKVPKQLECVGIIEWSNLTQLENLIQQDQSEQQIQAFLVASRILSARSWDSVKLLFRQVHRDVLPRITSGPHQENKLKFLWSMLETIRDCFDASEKGLWLTTCDIVQCLLVIVNEIPEFEALPPDQLVEVNINTIAVTSLKLIAGTDQFHLNHRETIDYEIYDQQFGSLFFLLLYFSDPPSKDREVMMAISTLVRGNQRRLSNGKTLLHFAFYPIFYDQSTVLNTMVELLLQAGADPNAVDHDGNAPLHHLAQLNQNLSNFKRRADLPPEAVIYERVARLLLEKGAHLDRVNNEKKTAADVWLECHPSQRSCDLPSWLRSVPSLMCLSARVIASNRIPYLDLPLTLHPFIAMH